MQVDEQHRLLLHTSASMRLVCINVVIECYSGIISLVKQRNGNPDRSSTFNLWTERTLLELSIVKIDWQEIGVWITEGCEPKNEMTGETWQS